MSLFDNLYLGFVTALSVQNLIYAFIGCALGTLIGVLPGLGPIATIAMLLPTMYALPPTSALIMLAGIYYGGPVRRFDHLDPDQCPRRVLLDCDCHRRLSNGATGPGRRRLVGLRARFVPRR